MRIISGFFSLVVGVVVVCYCEIYFIVFDDFPVTTITFGSPDSNVGIQFEYKGGL